MSTERSMLVEHHQAEHVEQLQWWVVTGSYAGALVAARTPEGAIALAFAVEDRGWAVAHTPMEPLDVQPPAKPPAPGVYAIFAE